MSFKAPDLTVAFGALFQDELKIYRIPSGCKVCSPGSRYFPVTGGTDPDFRLDNVGDALEYLKPCNSVGIRFS